LNLKTFRLISYLRYRLLARSIRQAHSPFVFSLDQEVFNNTHIAEGVKEIEVYRKSMLSCHERISIIDLGAGSRVMPTGFRTISDIAKYAAKPKKEAMQLGRLAKKINPKLILELGTSLGISAMYLSVFAPQARIISIEGDPKIAALSRNGIEHLGFKNIEVLNLDFDGFIKERAELIHNCTFLVLDGNHTYEATLRYFNSIFPLLPEDACMVIDDINWSEGMQQAWEEIVNNPTHKVSIDLYNSGWIFKRSAQAAEHFIAKA
jgi:predicted O-methyltransferase YrrM